MPVKISEYIEKEGKEKTWTPFLEQMWYQKCDISDIRKKHRRDQEDISHTKVSSDRLRKFFSIFLQRKMWKMLCSEKKNKARVLFSRHEALIKPDKKLMNLHLIFLHLYMYCRTLLLANFFPQCILNQNTLTCSSSNFSSMTNQEA